MVQAFEEVKGVYSNYPKRGLKWTNGWIDRGGWKPQQFSGNYFYAQVTERLVLATTVAAACSLLP